MDESNPEDNHDTATGRFFSVKEDEAEKRDSRSLSLEPSAGSDEGSNRCWTLRILQHLLPCLKKKGVWEPSQGDVFKSHDAEEAKYPKILRILENRLLDITFILSCYLSIFLFLFSEGFLLKSRLLWGLLHLVNAVYAAGLFSQWLQILIKSKYAKTNHGYTTRDIVYTLLSVFPADLIVLCIYALHDDDDNKTTNPISAWMITASRVNYLLRIRNIMQYFSKWEDHLVVGDFKMFLLRTFFFATFLMHMFACIWHRIACDSFELSHFMMRPDEAIVAVCKNTSWIGTLKLRKEVPLLNHSDGDDHWNVAATHYFVSVYWTVITSFRLGASDIRTSLGSDMEVAFVTFVEITAWIFVLAHVNGTLASLFIEKDMERQNFITRCFAIRHYLQFGELAKSIQDDVTKFYNYLWDRSCGILHLDLVDVMPQAMKSEVFYDVNKFVLDQLPMLKGLEIPFLMSLSVQMKHRFYTSGEILFHKNETSYSMYYLVKGFLEVMTEDEQHPITTIRSGSVIGEIHLLQPYLHVSTVRCGSDCEIRTLSRKHFKQVLSIYPQYVPVLQQRLESRLEQCGLLLALCEKHNTYQKAFNALREVNDTGSMDFHRSDFSHHSFENVTKILPQGPHDKVRDSVRYSYDFDGITLSGEIEDRLNQSLPSSSENRMERKGFDELVVAAFEALENDVARAVALANDLNIPRQPLNVHAPETTTHVTLGFNQQAISENVCVSLFKRLKHPSKSKLDFAWKFLVSACALLVFWYYPFQFTFHSREDKCYHAIDYVFHLTDIIFAMDCVYDMVQVVVTPQKTFESANEIAMYRLKSFYFYFRVFSFLPLEYIFARLVATKEMAILYQCYHFYAFKFNRLLQIHLVFRFLHDFEVRFRVKPVFMIMGKFALGLFFVTHTFTVLHAFVVHIWRTTLPKMGPWLGYRESFYWSIVIVTSTGYGDSPSDTDAELTVEVIGLIVGVSSLIFLAAKATAILANGESKRISFQQNFYALEAFMRHRKFPKPLVSRVTTYYKLQWSAHQGTLIPTGRSIIWDTPKSIKTRVCHAQAHKYISRIPLFMNSPIYLQNEICVALKHYIIPPREILLHPGELARDLYIISKGYVEVTLEAKRIAIFTEGRYFGLSGLLYGVNTPYTFKTLTHCQVFCLSHANMIKVANSNPNFLHEIDLLSGNDKLAAFQPVDLSDHAHELPPYPSKEFLDKLFDLHHCDFPKGATNAVASCFRNCCSKVKSPFLNAYFLPNGSALKWWIGIRLVFAICVTIFAPAQVAFLIKMDTGCALMWCFDIVAWIDMLISLRIAYYGDKNQLVTNWRKMAAHYLKGPFLLDLLACFPVDVFVHFYYTRIGSADHRYHIVALLRLNRMLQSYKILLVNGYLEKVMFKSLSFVMLTEMAPAMFLFINVTTCLSVLQVCGYSFDLQPRMCNADAWILNGLRRLNYDNYTYHVNGTIEELNDTVRSYLVGLYWVTQSVLSVGYGDIEIGKSQVNQIVATVVIFLGVLMANYAGGKLTSCIIGEDPAKIELQEKMTLLDDYLEQQRASRNLRRRVREAYFNAWDKTNGVSPTNLFLALPPSLKTDVMKQLYGSTLKTSPLFENLDGPGIRMLASSLQEIFYPEGEFLMKFGDLCNDVFFIAHGAVVCYNVRGVIMSQLGGGSIIGETASFFHTHRLYTAIAVKDVNAYVFKKEAFMNFLNQYPHFKFLLETYSYQHYREAMMGPKKDTVDYNVILSYQNEKSQLAVPTATTGTGGKTRSSRSAETLTRSRSPMVANDEVTLVPPASRRSTKGKFVFLTSSDLPDSSHDLTRNTLKEDLLKNPDDLSKSATEKWWSVVVTFGRMARDEMGLVHIYQEVGQCNILTFTVHPASAICTWVSVYLVLTALSCSITAYEIAYEGMEGAPETGPLFVFRDVLEIFFVIRIIGNFHLGYYDETATLITDVKTISRRYAYKPDGLFLDIFTTFPFYLFTEFIVSHTAAGYVRSVQLLRVFLFVRYLQESDSSLKMKASRVKIMKITILLCFIFHFWACAWYLVACYGAHCTRGSWMNRTLHELIYTEGPDPFTEEPRNVTIMSKYLLSLYYVTNALTATGFAHITARTDIELCLSIMMMFGTVFVIGYLVGEMVQCLASQVATKIHYQHKLTVLENHFTSLGISYEKILEVREYFKLLWCRCKGVMLFNLVEELPYSLRADVAMEIYGPNLKSSRILGKLDENLIRQICARIRHEIYFPGSHIIRAGDVSTSMYFIKKGEVVVLDGNSNLELCVEILYENECFGEVKVLLPKEQYRFSYVARIESEVGVLHKEDLEAVLKNHPRMFEELKDKANKVKARRQSRDEDEKGNVHGAASGLSIKSIKSNKSGQGGGSTKKQN